MARQKPKQLVKYHNDLNLIAFKSFSKVENDVFFALMWKLKNQANKEIRLDFAELRELIDLRNMTNKEIEKSISDIGRKISSSLIEFETETERQFFTIFQVLAVPKDTDDFYIRAKINKPFLYILNNFEKGGFTMWELIEFSNLTSKYTQTLYRILKQFRSTGTVTIFENDWDKFVEIMDIPKGYAMSDIDKRILTPAIKELSEKTLFSTDRVIFENLKYEKKRGRSKGRPVVGIEFRFLPQTENQHKLEQVRTSLKNLEQIERQKQAIEQIKTTKTNPITGEQVSILNGYISQYISVMDIKTQMYNRLKIRSLKEDCGRIIAELYNADDDYLNEMKFESFEHFKKWFEKYSA